MQNKVFSKFFFSIQTEASPMAVSMMYGIPQIVSLKLYGMCGPWG